MTVGDCYPPAPAWEAFLEQKQAGVWLRASRALWTLCASKSASCSQSGRALGSSPALSSAVAAPFLPPLPGRLKNADSLRTEHDSTLLRDGIAEREEAEGLGCPPGFAAWCYHLLISILLGNILTCLCISCLSITW